MNTWEDILNAYLEGSVLRADAEALRWKIRLSDEVRGQIDRDLRLADALESLGQSIAASDGAAEKLVASLGAEANVTAPAHWRWSPAGPCGVIESRGVSSAPFDAGDSSEEDDAMDPLAGELMQLGRTIVPPPGALERLITRLHQEPLRDSNSDESGEAMEGDRPIVLFPGGLNLAPDALAASKADEPEKDEDSDETKH